MAYSDYLSSDTIEPMIWETLVAMEEQAVEAVPVALVNGGNLRNSITITTSRRKKQEGASDDGLEQITGENVGAIGSSAEYAAAVEFGRPDMPNYPAQPYLRPALDIVRSKIGKISGEELKKQLELYAIRHPYRKDK